jgi:hypothetical protein
VARERHGVGRLPPLFDPLGEIGDARGEHLELDLL